MRLIKLVLACVTAVAVAACATGDQYGNPYGAKQTGGTLIGAAAGGLLGSQIGHGGGRLAAVAIGTLGGALIGSEVGKSLDRADRIALEQSTQRALETGRSGAPVGWHNPDSGHYGQVVPQPAYRSSSGEYCREYQQTVTIDGRPQSAYGTACRQPDGSWQVVNS